MKLQYVDFHAGEVRKEGPTTAQSFNANVAILDASVKDDVLNVAFDYVVGYAPGNSSMHINGKAAFVGKEAKAAYAEWTKSKKMTGETGEFIANAIYYHSSLQAIGLSRLFGLTAPVVFPKMKLRENK